MLKCVLDSYRETNISLPEERDLLRSYGLWDDVNNRLDEEAVERLYMELR